MHSQQTSQIANFTVLLKHAMLVMPDAVLQMGLGEESPIITASAWRAPCLRS